MIHTLQASDIRRALVMYMRAMGHEVSEDEENFEFLASDKRNAEEIHPPACVVKNTQPVSAVRPSPAPNPPPRQPESRPAPRSAAPTGRPDGQPAAPRAGATSGPIRQNDPRHLVAPPARHARPVKVRHLDPGTSRNIFAVPDGIEIEHPKPEDTPEQVRAQLNSRDYVEDDAPREQHEAPLVAAAPVDDGADENDEALPGDSPIDPNETYDDGFVPANYRLVDPNDQDLSPEEMEALASLPTARSR